MERDVASFTDVVKSLKRPAPGNLDHQGTWMVKDGGV